MKLMLESITKRLPAFFTFSSLLALVILVLTTNPVDKIGYTMIFFLFLLVFFASLAHLLIYRFRGKVSAKSRYRIFIISLAAVALVMFRSAQSLGWLDGIVLAATTGGLLFYSSRR